MSPCVLPGHNDMNGRLCGVQLSGRMTAVALLPQLTVSSHKPREADWHCSKAGSETKLTGIFQILE